MNTEHVPESRTFPDNDNDSHEIVKGSTGMFQDINGLLCVAEVLSVDESRGTITFKIYELEMVDGSNSFYLAKIDQKSTSLSHSLLSQAKQDNGGNLKIKASIITPTVNINTIKLIEVLDISQKNHEYNLINISKFGGLKPHNLFFLMPQPINCSSCLILITLSVALLPFC